MTSGQHILIVEDDRITALIISEYLAANGYRTTVATTGRDGIERYLDDDPDLVLCDALLPRVNGFDACMSMRRALGPRVPIVMMSAYYRSHRQALEQVPDLDVDGFLVKPFDLDILLDRVQSLLPAAPSA